MYLNIIMKLKDATEGELRDAYTSLLFVLSRSTVANIYESRIMALDAETDVETVRQLTSEVFNKELGLVNDTLTYFISLKIKGYVR